MYLVIGRKFENWKEAYLFAYQKAIELEKEYIEVCEGELWQAPIIHKVCSTENFENINVNQIFRS